MLTIIFIIVIPVAAGFFVYLNNELIRKRNAIDQAYFSIDVMLKKRYDLIPMLVDTVQGFLQHERGLMIELTRLRSAILSGDSSIDEKIQADNQVNDCIHRTVTVAESYPNLKSNPSFIHLQGALNETEEQLAASRRFLNAAVADYHNSIESFPSNAVASLRGMKKRHYFTIPDQEKLRPILLINKEP
jgi:LemA protein